MTYMMQAQGEVRLFERLFTHYSLFVALARRFPLGYTSIPILEIEIQWQNNVLF